jgi:hypothetical protein
MTTECLTGEYLKALTTLGNSGAPTIDYIFKLCVVLLTDLAQFLGTSYEAINIWIFVIIWPILTLYLILRVILLRVRLRRCQSI